MSTLAPLLEAFFTERLIGQRDASPHTVASYRDAICLLLRFAQRRTGKAPHQLDLDDLDAPLIGAFLNHLEAERGVSVRTRNARLTAIRSLFGFAAYRHPEHAAVIQRVLAIPAQADRPGRGHLPDRRRDARPARRAGPLHPDRPTRSRPAAAGPGNRAAGQRAHRADLRRGPPRHRRARPLPRAKDARNGSHRCARQTRTTAASLAHRARRSTQRSAVPGPTGRPLSRDAIRRLVDRHVATAAPACPSLTGEDVSPHTLRHSCAMNLLRHGVDAATIALWLGHEDVRTTYGVYLHADLSLKEKALARTAPPGTPDRPLPAARPAPRVPRKPVNMPTLTGARPPPLRTRGHRRRIFPCSPSETLCGCPHKVSSPGGCSIIATGRSRAGRHGSHAGRSPGARSWRVNVGSERS